jgi:DNA (cytosine-5)-methyltransferase 1
MSASGPIRRARDGGRNDWRTPPELFDLLMDEYRFDIDGAASDEWHLCPRYYSEEWDAFGQRPAGESIFLNPPYGNLAPWVGLASEWGTQGNEVLALVPAATDARWWHDAVRTASSTTLLTGRVSFIDATTGKPGKANTSGSSLFLFDRRARQQGPITLWDWKDAARVRAAKAA